MTLRRAKCSFMGDREDIERVKYQYLRALDTKHWDDFTDALTEDVVGDYGSSVGEGITSPTARLWWSTCERRCPPT